MLRSLTMTPAASAIDMARRMARRRLEVGGVVAQPSGTKSNEADADFVLPAGIDPLAVAKAVRQKLDVQDSKDELHPLERMKLGGRVVLPRRHLLRLGDGRFDLGRAFMHGLIKELHARRMRRL
jgi:hypothetical protein